MASKILISVVVCTYNRAHLLDKCIRSLFAQSLERDLFEIIVVDNASTDTTAEVLTEFKDKEGFLSFYEPDAGLSKARNTGWKIAKGEYVGYLDDDAIADEHWLQSALWGFENFLPKPEALTGRIRLMSEAVLPDWINDDLKAPLGYLNLGDAACQMRFAQEKIVGANCFFAKAILERLGGFNEDLGRKKKLLLSGEEVQLQKEIEQAGGAVWYSPDVSIQHYVPEERTKPIWYYKRYYWGGVSDLIMSRNISSQDEVLQSSSEKLEMEAGMSDGGKVAQLQRLVRNCWQSLGVFSSQTTVIQSRIYMSYVWGYVYSAVSIRWKKI